MGPLTDAEMAQRLASSAQVKEYATAIDRESARELLAKRIAGRGRGSRERCGRRRAALRPRLRPRAAAVRRSQSPAAFEKVVNSPLTRTVAAVVARGIMGALLPRKRTTTRKRGSLW